MNRKEFDRRIGLKIKNLRNFNKGNLKKMSQRELAENMDCSWQQLHKYEKGKNSVCLYNLKKIAEIFDVNVGDFFDQSSDTNMLMCLTREQSKIISFIITTFAEINNAKIKKE